MSVSVIAYPDYTLNADIPEVSKWNAVFHPIKYGFQRKDFNINTISDSSGKVQVNWLDDTPRDITVGDMVYVKSGPYNFTAEVLTVDPGDTYIIVDKTFTSTSSGGWVNSMTARKNYFISVKVYHIVATQYTYLNTFEPKPDTTGRVDLDVSPALRELVDLKDTNTYDAINKAMVGMGGKFNIIYNEQWDGNADDEYTSFSNANIRYWVASSRQVQDRGGFNMAPFVTFPPDTDSPYEESSKAKFMSDFERPTYFVGYPFDISFIYSEKVSLFGVYRNETLKDASSQEISNSSTQLDANESIMPNGLMLSGSFASTVKTVDVYLECDTDVSISSGYDTGDFDSESFDEGVDMTTESFTYEDPID